MSNATAAAPEAKSALIYQAIPKVMAAVGAIEKKRQNEQQKYKFRGIDDVFAAFQRPLVEAGLFYVPEVLAHEHESVPTKSGGMMNYTRLQVAYTFYAQDGSSVRAVVAGEAMDSADKSTNKAMSAALKYALLQIFCVPVEQEDADQETHEMAARPAPTQRGALGGQSATPTAAAGAPTTRQEQVAELKQKARAKGLFKTLAEWKAWIKDGLQLEEYYEGCLEHADDKQISLLFDRLETA